MTVHGPAPAPPARSRGRRVLAVTAAVVAVVAVAAAIVVVRALAPGDCSASSPTVVVAADPAVAAPLAPALGAEQRTPDGPWGHAGGGGPRAARVAPALGAEQRTPDGTCVQVRVVARRAADVARDIAAGQGPHLWVADSTASVQRALPARSGAAPTVEVGPPLVRTPLVVVTDPASADQAGWSQAPPTWRTLLTGALPVSIADPERTGEGLAALVSAAATLGVIDPANPPVDVVNGLVRLGRTRVADPQEAVRDRTKAPAAVATEQAALAAGADGPSVIYPAEGSVPLDYPVVRVRRPAELPDLDAAVASAHTALRSAAVLAALQSAGFRDPAGRLSERVLAAGAPPGTLATAPTVLPALPQPVVDQVLGLWGTVNTPLRLLSVIDVSGSMAEPAGDGRSRLDVARDAGLTGLALFSDDSVTGFWAFSRELTPTTDWLELDRLDVLTAPADGGDTHRAAIQRSTAELAGLVGGGTALYDTTLAAVREVQRGYRPDLLNTVVLFTDGRNDDPVGIDRTGLVETLRAEANPARPVRVYAIGIGPDADLAELTAIAEATGGQAYLARDPADVERVFFDAYARFTCGEAC